MKVSSTQRCSQLETSHSFELIEDNFGNQILHFTFDTFPPYATKVLTIKADLKLSNTPRECSVEDLDTFLQAEQYIESDHPKIIELARKIKAIKTRQTIKNIFHWIIENIRYTGYQHDDLGALYALKKREGDCTEFMYLFVALCRANRIPARCVGGYICKQNEIVQPSGYHNWAEIYVNGTWQPVDPQNRVFNENPSQYIAMRLLGNAKGNPMGDHHRFRFECEGLKVRMDG